jgi:hypothetical protein
MFKHKLLAAVGSGQIVDTSDIVIAHHHPMGNAWLYVVIIAFVLAGVAAYLRYRRTRNHQSIRVNRSFRNV